MTRAIIEQRLKAYEAKSGTEELNAMKEILQEVALCGLARASFFDLAAFQGGSCLRIVHHLNRYSEDLDFIALQQQKAFVWEPFLKVIQDEFLLYGLSCNVVDKSAADSVVKAAFLKDNSFGKVLVFNHLRGTADEQVIKIKLEIDTNPPAASCAERVVLDFPYVFTIVTQDLPSLFAGKCHALLCRTYTKGRDWFDFAWYAAQRVLPNYEHLGYALDQAGPWQGQNIIVTLPWLIAALSEKIKTIDWEVARADAARFLHGAQKAGVDAWSQAFFQTLIDRLAKS